MPLPHQPPTFPLNPAWTPPPHGRATATPTTMEPRRQPPPLRHHKPPRPKAPDIDPLEPSSPKVSCIGQVRAKTSGRRRRRSEEVGGAVAFRSRSLRRDQSWVHLPFGCACELLKFLASAFCSFWRCGGRSWRSTCCCCSCSCEVCGEERREVEKDAGVLAAAVAEKGKSCGLRELEMVADKLEKGRLVLGRRGEGDDESFDEDDEEMESCGGANNALLLMRCRSDPMKMSALAACFMDSAADADNAAETGDLSGVHAVGGCEDGTGIGGKDPDLNCGEEDVGLNTREIAKEECLLAPVLQSAVAGEAEGAKGMSRIAAIGEEMVARRHSSVSTEKEQSNPRGSRDADGSRRHSFSSEKDTFHSRLSSSYREGRRSSFSTERDTVRPPQLLKLLQAEKLSITDQVAREGERRNELPDCLLLMMYEPKLSTEVSRETWVCTKDFVRWCPRHWQRVNRKGGDGNQGEDRVDEELKGGSVRHCERNERPPMNAESAVSLSGPFVLMRCKSEPARPSPGIGVQKGFFWKSRYEPMGANGDAGILAANR